MEAIPRCGSDGDFQQGLEKPFVLEYAACDG